MLFASTSLHPRLLASRKSRGRFVCNSFTSGGREGEKLAESRGSSYQSSPPAEGCTCKKYVLAYVFVLVSSTLLRGCFVTKPRKREKSRDIKAGWKVAGGIEIQRVNLRGRLLRLKGYRLIRCCAAGIIKGRLDVSVGLKGDEPVSPVKIFKGAARGMEFNSSNLFLRILKREFLKIFPPVQGVECGSRSFRGSFSCVRDFWKVSRRFPSFFFLEFDRI